VTSRPRGHDQQLPMAKSSSASGWGPRKRQTGTTPQATPRSLGAGPSKHGQAVRAGDGKPTHHGDVRRRDGSEAPAARYLVARGDDAATEPCVREQPQRGWTRHKQGARSHGCEDSNEIEGSSCRAEAASRGGEKGGGTKGNSASSAEGEQRTIEGERSADGEETAVTKRKRAREAVSAERNEDQSTANGSTRHQGDSELRRGSAHRAQQEGRDDRGRHRLLDRAPPRDDAVPRRVQESRRREPHDGVRGPHRQGGHSDHGGHDHNQRGDRWRPGKRSACSTEAQGENEDGTRRMQEEEQWTPMWQRRPAWLYLPHQYEGERADDVRAKRHKSEATEQAQTAEEDERIRVIEAGKGAGKEATEMSEAKKTREEGQRSPAKGPREEGKAQAEDVARSIRGRETSPGATARHLDSREGEHRERGEVQRGDATGGNRQSEIRGPPDGPGAATIGRRIGAQEKLDARNAHLRASLQLHAERVAKRASEEQQGPDKPSAQERMMAIRRRLAERTRQHQEVRVPGGGAMAAAASTEAWEDRGRSDNTLNSSA
jgi:hypothetical protein